jgi:hypothetical protein
MSKRYDISRRKKDKLMRRTAIINYYNRKASTARRGMGKDEFRQRLICDLKIADNACERF